MTLELNGLAIDCIIGDLPEERLRAQRLVADVTLEITDGAAESDSLADTVDYAALAGKIRATLERARCRMLERAACLAANVCAAERHVRSADVKITKCGAVPGLASASATFHASRLVQALRKRDATAS